jgi:hypothetical protein
MGDVIDQIAIKKYYLQELFFNRVYNSSRHEYNPMNGAKFIGNKNEIYARINVYCDYVDDPYKDRLIGIRITLILDIYDVSLNNDKHNVSSEVYEVDINDPNGVDFLFNKIEVLLLKYKMDIPVIYYTYNITTNSTSSTISNYTYA